jgi:VanZ family protein
MRIVRAVLICAPLAIAGAAPPAHAETFSLGDVDKQAHVAVSYGVTLTGAVIGTRYRLPRWQAVAVAAAATLVIATVKELVVDDAYSWPDQPANPIGAGAAAAVAFSFRL